MPLNSKMQLQTWVCSQDTDQDTQPVVFSFAVGWYQVQAGLMGSPDATVPFHGFMLHFMFLMEDL